MNRRSPSSLIVLVEKVSLELIPFLSVERTRLVSDPSSHDSIGLVDGKVHE